MNDFNVNTFDSMQINLKMYDDANSSRESHMSSSNSSFSYGEIITPLSGPSRRPSTTSMDWDSQYLSPPIMSQHQIADNPSYCSSGFSLMDPLLVLQSHQLGVPSAGEMTFLNSCVMANGQNDESGTVAMDDMFLLTNQMSHWERSEMLVAQQDMPNVVNLPEYFTMPTLGEASIETSCQPVHESTEDIQLPVQNVLPSQTIALPLLAKQTLVDPLLTPIKTEPPGGLEDGMLASSPLSYTYTEASSSTSEVHIPSSPVVSECYSAKRSRRTNREACIATLKKRGGIREDYPCRIFAKPSRDNECTLEKEDGKPCDRKFERREHLKRHVKTVHTKNGERFACDVLDCKHTSTRMDNLKQHIRNTHLKESSGSRNRRLPPEARVRYMQNSDSIINQQTSRRQK